MQNAYTAYLQATNEFGSITSVHHPLVTINGLPHVSTKELVIFENGAIGEVFTLAKNSIQVLVFSPTSLRLGMKATRTNVFSSIPVGEELLGRVIDPLGTPLFSKENRIDTKERRELEVAPLGIKERTKINQPFYTGVSVVDLMVPLGKGQKELVIGDRKTGKSAFVLTTIKNQIKNGAVAIYCCVAKKKSDIKKVETYLKNEGILSSCVIVATTSFDSPALIYLTPYSAMSIAEYFRDQGQEVVVVLDDLTTHAKFYRELSLIANRFPGRDSYPGDIFYTHARLLERSGNFKHHSGKNVSITVLPVAEIIEGDFTGYIATNLMGMTDGHIFFDSNIYYQGRRPSVNILLSVTRVGRQAQSDVLRSINRELTSFFSLYDKMQNLSHFGAELTDSVVNILKTGEILYTMFNQPPTITIPLSVQVILFGLLWLKFFNDVTPASITKYRNALISAYQIPSTQQLFDQIVTTKTFNELLNNLNKNREQLIKLCQL